MLGDSIVNLLAFDSRQGRLSRITLYFDIAKAVICETWLVSFLSLPTQDVSVGGESGAQVVEIECAVVAEPFGVPQRHLSTASTFNPEPAPVHHVLAHVENIGARLGFGDLHGLDGFRDANGLDHLGRETALGTFHFARLLPAEITGARAAPACDLFAGIVE